MSSVCPWRSEATSPILACPGQLHGEVTLSTGAQGCHTGTALASCFPFTASLAGDPQLCQPSCRNAAQQFLIICHCFTRKTGAAKDWAWGSAIHLHLPAKDSQVPPGGQKREVQVTVCPWGALLPAAFALSPAIPSVSYAIQDRGPTPLSGPYRKLLCVLSKESAWTVLENRSHLLLTTDIHLYLSAD